MAHRRHSGVFELVYLAQGMQFRAHSGVNHPLHAGELLVVPPGARHSSGVMPVLPGTAYWLHVRSQGPLLDLSAAEAGALRAGLHGAGAAPVGVPAGIEPAWRGAVDILRHPRVMALDRVRLRGHFYAILLSVADAGTRPRAELGDRLVTELAGWLADDPARAARPETVARRAGISISRLRARVRSDTGLALGDWLMRLRIHAAMRILAGEPERAVTAIAFDLGFASSQYFATCFRRYASMSPSDFRADLASSRGRRRLAKVEDPRA